MKKQQRIALLESEISRLKVAKHNIHERLEAIEGELGLSHPDYLSMPIKSNSSEIPNTCLNIKPESPECVANNGVGEKRAGIHIHTSNLDSPVKPDFIPDWKDAPKDAVCVAMDKDGQWFWWRFVPEKNTTDKEWLTNPNGFLNGLTLEGWEIGTATNAHLLPPGYWESTLQMRPVATTKSVPGDWATAPDWAKYKAMDGTGSWYWYCSIPRLHRAIECWEIEISCSEYKLIPNHPATSKHWTETLEARPDAKPAEPDYSHLLPEGYEFCQEGENDDWVKVELLHKSIIPIHRQQSIGSVLDDIFCCDDYKPYYRPIRKVKAINMDAFESAKAESRHKADVMNAYIQAWLDYNNLPYGMDYLAELDKVVIKAEQYYRRIYAL